MDCAIVEQHLSVMSSGRRGRSSSVGRGLSSLPHGVGQSPAAVWKCKFIPTFIALLSIDTEVWKILPKAIIPVLQKIWDAVYPGKTYTIKAEASDPVYYQVCICSLRNGVH